MPRIASRPALIGAAFIATVASALTALAQAPSEAPEVTLTRLDCGSSPEEVSVARFSDTFAYPDLKLKLTYSCYLIKHGSDYMIWDAGNAMGSDPRAPKTSLPDLLGQLKVSPEQVKFLGVSHYHGDHIGQAASFPKATLLIGKGDWDVLSGPPQLGVNPKLVEPWISGGSKVEPQSADRKDVFGDGTVIMLNTPGHTPGHHSLLVKLKETGNVLLTGDIAHFEENYASNGVPSFNTNRADTLASLDRFKKIAENLKAKVVIQHDPRDVPKLPAFPAAAK